LIAFAILALVLVATAVFTVTAVKPVYSVIGLLANFLALAILYLTLQAEFLAVIQIVVYSGAILILFVFVIALLSSGVRPFEQGPDRLPRVIIPAAVLSAVAVGLIAYANVSAGLTATPRSGATAGPVGTADVFGSVGDFGIALFTTNLLPFEITAFVLMVAVIGVVVIAGEQAPVRSARSRREPIARTERERTGNSLR